MGSCRAHRGCTQAAEGLTTSRRRRVQWRRRRARRLLPTSGASSTSVGGFELAMRPRHHPSYASLSRAAGEPPARLKLACAAGACLWHLLPPIYMSANRAARRDTPSEPRDQYISIVLTASVWSSHGPGAQGAARFGAGDAPDGPGSRPHIAGDGPIGKAWRRRAMRICMLY